MKLERVAQELVERLLLTASEHKPLRTLRKRLNQITYECLRDTVNEVLHDVDQKLLERETKNKVV